MSTQAHADAVIPVLVLIGCTIGTALSVASFFNTSLTSFIKPIALDTGWGRGQIALSSTVSIAASVLMLPFVGRLADRFGPRRVIVVSIPFYAAAVAVVGLAPFSYFMHLAACAAVGLFGAAAFAPTYNALLARFFDARLGLALGVASAGAGAATMISPVLAHALIEQFGWRGAYVAMGALIGVVLIPASLLLLREGNPPQRSGDAPAGVTGVLRTLKFWQAAASYFLMAVALGGIFLHLVSLLNDRGADLGSAAIYASLLGASSFVVRIVVGLLLDRFDAGWLGAIAFVLGGIGVLLVVGDLGLAMTALGIVLLGCALGAETDLLPYVVRRLFGTENYGAVVSAMAMAFMIGTIVGPVLAGLSFDRLGNYDYAFYAFAAAAFVAALLHAPITQTDARVTPAVADRPGAH
jgi:MFS family permease